MHHRNAQKYGFARALVFCTVGIIGFVSGCVLEDLPTVGVQCPPGKQVLEGEGAPYVEINQVVCHHKYFESRVYPVAQSELTNCCEEDGEDHWKCNLSKYDVCKDKYSSDIKSDVAFCYYYQKTSLFGEEKNKVYYSAKCAYGETCEDNTDKLEVCPGDFPDCELTDKSEEKIFICNQTCLEPRIYCPDEATKEKTPVCINPQTDNMHCGARGSCTNDKEGDSKGVVCENGKICISGECKCPEGYDLCNGKCTYIRKDHDNCGKCGNKCEEGQACTDGKCQEDKCESEGITNACSQADCTNIPNQCGKNCINCTTLPNVVNATCIAKNGICEVSECQPNYHLSEDKTSCEINTVTACAGSQSNEIVDCTKAIKFGTGLYCNHDGKCMATGCKKDEENDENYSLDNNGQCISACALCKEEKNEVCNAERTGCRCKETFAFCPEGDRGVCVNILTDHDHCGGCGEQFVCGPNEVCTQAQCQGSK